MSEISLTKTMNMISTDDHTQNCSCFYAVLLLIGCSFKWFMCIILKNLLMKQQYYNLVK